jgi:hypothetical protein
MDTISSFPLWSPASLFVALSSTTIPFMTSSVS